MRLLINVPMNIQNNRSLQRRCPAAFPPRRFFYSCVAIARISFRQRGLVLDYAVAENTIGEALFSECILIRGH